MLPIMFDGFFIVLFSKLKKKVYLRKTEPEHCHLKLHPIVRHSPCNNCTKI